MENEIKQTTAEYCIDQIKKLSDGMTSLHKECKEALEYFNGDSNIVKSPKKRSQATTTDFRDTVEWLRPSLLDIFTSNYEVCRLDGGGGEDISEIKKLDKLVNYQLRVLNKWYLVIRDFIDDALMFRVGAIKYQWIVEEHKEKKKYNDLTIEEVEALKNNPDITIIGEMYTEQAGIDQETGMLKFSYTLTAEHLFRVKKPLIECVPLSEIGFKTTAKDITNTFIWHKISYNKFDFIAKYGEEKFNKIKQSSGENEDNTTELRRELFKDIGDDNFMYDEKEDKYKVYECYYRDPKTGEPTITEICGEVELSTEENKYRRPPFIISSILRRSHRVVGSSQFELNKNFQRIRTAILRQMLDNLYFCNNRRYFVDPTKVDMKDYLNKNEPGAAIKVRGGGDPRSCAAPEDKAPIPAEIFAFWETLLVEKDYHTGLPRSFQGVNSKTLNKTFRGQAQQVEQASQRVAEIARNMAETVVVPLVEEVINMNIRFLDEETTFRYLNETITLSPDNLCGKYDIIVNVGIGTGDKDKKIMHMEQLLGLLVQAAKIGMPIANMGGIFNIFKDIIQEMGYKNINDYISDPKINKLVMNLVKMVATSGLIEQQPQLQGVLQELMVAFGMNILPEKTGTEGTNPAQGAQPYQPSLPMSGDYFG